MVRSGERICNWASWRIGSLGIFIYVGEGIFFLNLFLGWEVEKEFLVELIGELHRVEYLEMIEACVLLGFSQFAVAVCPFLVFSFFSYLGISSIAAIAVPRYGVSE